MRKRLFAAVATTALVAVALTTGAMPARAVDVLDARGDIRAGDNWGACASVTFGQVQELIAGSFTAVGVVSGPGTHTIHGVRPILAFDVKTVEICIPGVGTPGELGAAT